MSWLEEIERKLAAEPVFRMSEREGLSRSAALVPLSVTDRQLWLSFERQSAASRGEGNYRFPTGTLEVDTEDEVDVALRAGAEALGIDLTEIMVLGQLDDVVTAADAVVTPVVGAHPQAGKADASRQVGERVVRIPLAALANPTAIEVREVRIAGERVPVPTYHLRGGRVGGSAARIVAGLLARLTSPSAAAVE